MSKRIDRETYEKLVALMKLREETKWSSSDGIAGANDILEALNLEPPEEAQQTQGEREKCPACGMVGGDWGGTRGDGKIYRCATGSCNVYEYLVYPYDTEPEESVLPVDPEKWYGVNRAGKGESHWHVRVPGQADVDFIMAMPAVAGEAVKLLKWTDDYFHEPGKFAGKAQPLKDALKEAGVTL